MITLSHEASRRLAQSDRVSFVYTNRTSRLALIDEAKTTLKNRKLGGTWGAELTSLAAHLETQLADDDAKIVALEAAVPEFEKAVADELAAHAAHEQAKAARAVGSLKRTEALRLAEDVEVTGQAVVIRRRMTAQQAAKVTAIGLPNYPHVPSGPGDDTIKTISAFAMSINPLQELDKNEWAKWLAMSEDEFRWLPVHAARWLKIAKDLYYEFPSDDFVALLAKLKAERAETLAANVRAAERELAGAKSRAAELSGGAA